MPLLEAARLLALLLLALPWPRVAPAGAPVRAGASAGASWAPVEDCNGNGIDDSVDIAVGRSADSNWNGVPDECELWVPRRAAALRRAFAFEATRLSAAAPGAPFRAGRIAAARYDGCPAPPRP